MTQRSKPVWAGLRHLTIAGLIGSGLGVLALPNLSDAQVPYSMGDGNPSVTVDLGVLNQLGPAENVPGLLNRGLRGGYALPGYPAQTSPGYASSPSSAVIGTAPQVPSWLQRQGGAQYAPVPLAAAPRAAAPTRAPARTATAPTLTPPARQVPVRQAPAATSPAAPTQQTATRTPPPSPPPAAETATPRASTPAPSPQPAETRTAAATPPPVPRTPPVATTPKPTASSSGSTARASAPPPPPAIPQAPSVEPAKTTVSAPPPPPPAATSQVASAPATQPAAAPAAAPSAQGADVTRVIFPSGESQLPDAGKSAMEPVIKKLQGDENLRLQLKAFASGGQDSTNTARRLSLSRALAVRAFLIDNNIQSTRMDVRALGDRSEGGPADRVDLIVVSP